MYCPSCGAWNLDEDEFCTSCGRPLARTGPHSRHKYSDTSGEPIADCYQSTQPDSLPDTDAGTDAARASVQTDLQRVYSPRALVGFCQGPGLEQPGEGHSGGKGQDYDR